MTYCQGSNYMSVNFFVVVQYLICYHHHLVLTPFIFFNIFTTLFCHLPLLNFSHTCNGVSPLSSFRYIAGGKPRASHRITSAPATVSHTIWSGSFQPMAGVSRPLGYAYMRRFISDAGVPWKTRCTNWNKRPQKTHLQATFGCTLSMFNAIIKFFVSMALSNLVMVDLHWNFWFVKPSSDTTRLNAQSSGLHK